MYIETAQQIKDRINNAVRHDKRLFVKLNPKCRSCNHRSYGGFCFDCKKEK